MHSAEQDQWRQFSSLDGISELIHGFISKACIEESPSVEQIRLLSEQLYSASLLKEEGRTVRARIVVAPPEALLDEEGNAPFGIHVAPFASAHRFSPNEIKRLSPAASYFHSAIGLWFDKNGLPHIWGILNTGHRWLNLAVGGRKPASQELPYPIIHVRDPGWLVFYYSYQLIAEWRGTDFHGPGLNVFRTHLLRDRYEGLRRRVASDDLEVPLPATLSIDTYADLVHKLAMQFMERMINLVRSSGHGGSVVLMPEGEPGLVASAKWIDCKYSAATDNRSSLRVRQILRAALRRMGDLCKAGSTAEEVWQIYLHQDDSELDRLDEAFFEMSRFYADLMQVDGALVLDLRLNLIGFGGEIRVDHNVFKVTQAMDVAGRVQSPWNVQSDGTRHRSVYRLCSVEPEVLGFVISQDSQVRMITNVNESVFFWTHTAV